MRDILYRFFFWLASFFAPPAEPPQPLEEKPEIASAIVEMRSARRSLMKATNNALTQAQTNALWPSEPLPVADNALIVSRHNAMGAENGRR